VPAHSSTSSVNNAIDHGADHLEDLATLAGGVAQEFNTLLSVVLGYGDLLEDLARDPARLREVVGHMMTAARRGADVVHQLQLFARIQECPLAIHDVHRLIRDQVGQTTHNWPPTVELSVQLPEEPALLLLNASQFSFALHHVLQNARECLRGSTGRIVLTTRLLAQPGAPVLALCVADNGAGMDPDTLARCTTPFFTQSRPPEKTGLGLSLVHGIVRSHGGRLLIESAPQTGTCVHICLPCPSSAAPPPRAGDLLFAKKVD
jgi:two-component system, cell cycle sensor histidine kinase and response regulator CckA